MLNTKKVLQFPDDYVVLDLETTGLSCDYDYILEICAIKYIQNEEADIFTTLINPGRRIPVFIEQLTGISTEMVKDAPLIESVIKDLIDFISPYPVIGHSISFDMSFLDVFSDDIIGDGTEITTIDTLRFARLLHRERQHNRLKDLAKYYNLPYEKAHRAEADCRFTNEIFHIFKQEYIDAYGDLENIDKNLIGGHKNKLKASNITATNDDIDETNPLYGKSVCFTGTLEKMIRKEAMQIVVNHGGSVTDGVTKKTNILVLGNNDYCSTIKDGKSTKQKKAEQLILDGQDLEIMPESTFYMMIDDN